MSESLGSLQPWCWQAAIDSNSLFSNHTSTVRRFKWESSKACFITANDGLEKDAGGTAQGLSTMCLAVFIILFLHWMDPQLRFLPRKQEMKCGAGWNRARCWSDPVLQTHSWPSRSPVGQNKSWTESRWTHTDTIKKKDTGRNQV